MMRHIVRCSYAVSAARHSALLRRTRGLSLRGRQVVALIHACLHLHCRRVRSSPICVQLLIPDMRAVGGVTGV